MEQTLLGSGSDSVLRHQAPPFIAERWRLALDPTLSAPERLGARLAFVETAVASLVGVMAAEVRGLSLTAPKALLDLEHRLERPTFGLWATAADALSRDLLAVQGMIAPGLPRILVAEQNLMPTPASEALRQVINVRNEVAHGSGGPVPTESEAEACLARIEDPLRVLSMALRRLGELRVFVSLESEERFGGGFKVRLGVFKGAEVEERELVLRFALRTRAPFLLGRDGTLLYLDPWLMFDRFGGSAWELRLLRQWDDGPRYESAKSHEKAKARIFQDITVKDPSSFVSGWSDRRRLSGALSPQELARIGGAPTGLPEVSISGYRLERRIGAGATGSVWLATALEPRARWGERVAVKILRRELLGDGVALERFRREYELASRLNHAVAMKVYDILEQELAGPCIVMEYVEGECLERNKQPVDGKRAALIVLSLLNLLGRAHPLGIVHRDIKPSNIILRPDGSVCLLDFGIAALIDTERLTRTLDGVGTAGFAAPEQLRHGPVDPRSDLYALGRLLLWLLGGGRVDDEAMTLPSVPHGVHAILHRALRPDPAERYRTAAEMQTDIEAFIQGRPVQAVLRVGDKVGGGDILVESVLGELQPGLHVAEVRQLQGGKRACMLFAFPCAFQELGRLVEQGLGGRSVTGPFHEPGSPARLCVTQVEALSAALEKKPQTVPKKTPSEDLDPGAVVAVGAAALGFGALLGIMAVAGGAAVARKQAASARAMAVKKV